MALNSDTISFLRHSVHIKFQKEARGYSKEQVQRTLAKLPPLADEIERLQNKLADYEARALAAEARLVEAQAPSEIQAPQMPAISKDFDETLRNTLVSAQRTADTTIREAQEEAERLRTEAEFQSNSLLADTRDQVSDMTKEAEDHRSRLMTEAESERAKMLEEASKEVKERLSKIEEELAQAHESERSNLLQQISELQETHKLLQSDVQRFEQHLENRREDVRKALSEITEVLDDPERLRVEAPIEPADIPQFPAEDYPPIGVNVESVAELEAEALVAAEVNAEPEELIDADEFVESLTIIEEEPEGYGIEEEYLPAAEYDDSYIDGDIDGDTLEEEELALADNRSVPPPPPASNGGGDPYLEELRRVTTEDPSPDDPITSFLEDEDGKSSGWFGRRK